MAKKRVFKVGKGGSYERYIMLTLRTMYAAGLTRFMVGELCSWAGLRRSSAMLSILHRLVERGWLSVEAAELRDGRRCEIFILQSAVWFGSSFTGKVRDDVT